MSEKFYKDVVEYLKKTNCEYLGEEDGMIFYRDLNKNEVFGAREFILAEKMYGNEENKGIVCETMRMKRKRMQ